MSTASNIVYVHSRYSPSAPLSERVTTTMGETCCGDMSLGGWEPFRSCPPSPTPVLPNNHAMRSDSHASVRPREDAGLTASARQIGRASRRERV